MFLEQIEEVFYVNGSLAEWKEDIGLGANQHVVKTQTH